MIIEKLIEIGDSFIDCLTIVDVAKEGRPCLYVNNTFEQVTGYKKEDIIGKNLALLQGELSCPETIAFMKECFDKGEACLQDIINYKKDGSIFLNRLLMLPLLSQKPDELIYVGLQNDLTAVRGLKESEILRKAQSGELHHAINNQLTIILGTYSKFLSGEFDSTSETTSKLRDLFIKLNKTLIEAEDVLEFEKFTY